MKLKTKLYSDAVKDALLSLSDIEFYNTIHLGSNEYLKILGKQNC